MCCRNGYGQVGGCMRVKRTSCAFCGTRLPDELWLKLDKHFSEESETLRSELQDLVGDVDSESSSISDLPSIDAGAFYSAHKAEAESLKKRIEDDSATYQKSLSAIKSSHRSTPAEHIRAKHLTRSQRRVGIAPFPRGRLRDPPHQEQCVHELVEHGTEQSPQGAAPQPGGPVPSNHLVRR